MSWLQQEDDTTPCSKVRRNRAKITARSLPNWILLKPDSVHLLSNKSVVGYSSATLRAGNKGAGACFIPVSGSKTIDLNDIKVVGYVDGCEGDVYVQQLDRYGRAQEAFTWYDLPEDDIYGWFNGSDEPVEEGAIVLAPGESLWVNAISTDYSIVFPGVAIK